MRRPKSQPAPEPDVGASSAPGEMTDRIRVDLPAPGWWRSRWGIAGLVLGALGALGGVAYAAHRDLSARIDKVEDRSDWIVHMLAKIAEKVGVEDVKPPPDPGR